MGSSHSRPRPRPRPNQQQQWQQNAGQFYGAGGAAGGYWPGSGPHAQTPPPPPGGGPHRPGPDGAYGGRAQQQQPPHGQVQGEYTQTATIKNQVNLKKASMAVEPLPGRPHDFQVKFVFDATAPCRATTFLLATEDPRDGCRLESAVLGAPPRAPVLYEKGMALKFPPEGDAAAAEAHIISSLHAPMGHMMLASGNSYPLVIRLEAVAPEERAAGRSLADLPPPGAPLPPWAQAQTTYARLEQAGGGGGGSGGGGQWRAHVIKQKIWVRGVSYELQEIYGMEAANRRRASSRAAAAAAAAGGAGGGGAGGETVPGEPVGGGPAGLATGSFDDPEGRECVICMSAERDTMALPCRHMSMCADCARALKTQTSRCPICRDQISSLLHIKMRRKSTRSRRPGEHQYYDDTEAAPAPAPAGAAAAGAPS